MGLGFVKNIIIDKNSILNTVNQRFLLWKGIEFIQSASIGFLSDFSRRHFKVSIQWSVNRTVVKQALYSVPMDLNSMHEKWLNK